jgi:hypothetical protein
VVGAYVVALHGTGALTLLLTSFGSPTALSFEAM